MKRKIVVLMPGLEKDLECSIREMADRLGFEAVICQTEEDAQRAVAEAEILLSNVASLCAQAPKLRWMCSSNAGVEPYLRPGAFASQDVMLTNSSGAYGVTIAEHIIMVTLEMMRREAEYRGIVAGHGFWAQGISAGNRRPVCGGSCPPGGPASAGVDDLSGKWTGCIR